ncbi:MAG: Asp-tRNA(Asn)/Glu-tRNA(Gln) amidotransferase subunit GatA [Gammaproteobacteria bacterium]|nr:Asp-tRNA(Asn)/Glu-tRNA(Gln) amidotransferase subunit GatA [Gammaproteobacteria bacterium]
MDVTTITKLAASLNQKEFSSVELTQHCLDQITANDQELNSFITVSSEPALEQAAAADEARAQNQNSSSPLLGIPVAHKDIFCTAGIKTTCGSRILDNFVAPYNATVVERLNAAGMVTLGKTNMDEFAMGSSSESSFYGPVHNPWRGDYVPGGSSGGSAAAVAARIAPVATGTDTGGSIRQPAALSGITGLKPTYGRISRYGMIAFASSLDQAGTLTQTAEDAALMLQAMAGFDERDSTCMDESVPDYSATLSDSVKGLRIGVPKVFFDEHLDSRVGDTVQAAIDALVAQGAEIIEVDLPNIHLSVPTYYVVAPAEASSNLSRFDGVRFGHRCDDPKDLYDMYTRTRGEGFGEEVKRRIMTGTYVLSAGYYDAYYLQAQKVRQLIADDFKQAFEKVDVVMGPTSPTPAFAIGAKTDDPVTMYLNDIYTIGVNLAGLPGMSVPCGFVDGLPVGLQMIGRHFDEARLLNVAHQYQQLTDWHQQAPSMTNSQNSTTTKMAMEA